MIILPCEVRLNIEKLGKLGFYEFPMFSSFEVKKIILVKCSLYNVVAR